MRILEIRLQDFRNLTFAAIDLSAGRTFFVGANGQGKSNILEGIGLITAFRSFRTQSTAVLPKKGKSAFSILYRLELDDGSDVEVVISFGQSGRKVQVDGEPVSKMGDFVGRFPVVPLSTGDLMLLRGAPSERRRFMDMAFSTVNPGYYTSLRRYHQALAERNRLLKHRGSAAEFSAFEAAVAKHGVEVTGFRVELMAELRSLLQATYGGLAEAEEGADLEYKANAECDEAGYRALLESSRERDQVIGATQRGPHRDDFRLSLSMGQAKEYASDGQQRGLCVALRIAQSRLYEARLGVVPVLLVDDVLGELDTVRRKGFWSVCPIKMQIIASGTELPIVSGEDVWSNQLVESGQVSPYSEAAN